MFGPNARKIWPDAVRFINLNTVFSRYEGCQIPTFLLLFWSISIQLHESETPKQMAENPGFIEPDTDDTDSALGETSSTT